MSAKLSITADQPPFEGKTSQRNRPVLPAASWDLLGGWLRVSPVHHAAWNTKRSRYEVKQTFLPLHEVLAQSSPSIGYDLVARARAAPEIGVRDDPAQSRREAITK